MFGAHRSEDLLKREREQRQEVCDVPHVEKEGLEHRTASQPDHVLLRGEPVYN